MAETFPQADAVKLLARCHRRCCICHRFCGSKMELDHMLPKAEGGPNDIDNAIPVCFECHAEIHAYNDKHPRGRKFRAEELKLHKEQWLNFCDKNPGALAQMSPDAGVGPMQALLDEMDFNIEVASRPAAGELGCELADHQFRRAIQTGALALLDETLKRSVNRAYVDVGKANHFLLSTRNHQVHGNAYNTALNSAQETIKHALPLLQEAKALLLQFLGPSTDSSS